MRWLEFYKYQEYANVMNLIILIMKVALAYLCLKTSSLEARVYILWITLK